MKKHTDPNARLGGELMSAKVVERLAAELKTGRYAGQDRLPAEVELAAQLGVSRTVVRDALSELEREGFLYSVPGKGSFVAGKNMEFVREEQLRKLEEHLNKAVEIARMCGMSQKELCTTIAILFEENQG